MEPSERTILFFDGDCGLCSRSVRMLMRMDQEARLSYAPLQGEVARKLLPENLRENLSTAVLYLPQAKGAPLRLTRSRAILEAVIQTKSPWRLLAKPARCLPVSLLDAVYNCIAKYRKHLFKASCPIPQTKLGDRLLP